MKVEKKRKVILGKKEKIYGKKGKSAKKEEWIPHALWIIIVIHSEGKF